MAVERARPALDDILALAGERPVAVFAHGAIGRVMRGLVPRRAARARSWRWTSLKMPSIASIAALRLVSTPWSKCKGDTAKKWPSSTLKPSPRRSARTPRSMASRSTVEKGEFVSLLGPSGCGKTTTLQMIAGFVEPTSGAIRLEGRDLLAVKPAKRGLGIVFQSYALFPHMTVAENVAFGLEMQGVAAAERAKRVGETLELVGLAAFTGRFPRQLSGGQQQRVALGPRAGHPAADPAARRAAQQSRRQAARGDADRAAPDPAHRRHDDDPGDARPGRGDGAVATASW